MLSIIWAFSATLIFTLVLALLPLGFTMRGKIFIALISFVLALGGLAAIPLFPLWETGLMLFLLVLLTAYFMGSRLGTRMLIQTNIPKEDSNNEFSFTKENLKTVEEDKNTLKLSKIEPTALEMVDQSQIAEPLAMDKITYEADVLDEDISFLLDRDSDADVQEKLQGEEEIAEVGYLSEIESLLDEESHIKNLTPNNDWLEKLDELQPLDEPAEDKSPSSKTLDVIDPDYLLFEREVAAAQEQVNKKVSLQK
jgi:hypothetical protein